MISFTVRMRFAEADRNDIDAILQELTAASRQESGCVSYVPHWVEGDAATVLIYEQYRDDEAAEFHRNTPHFAKFATGGLYQKMLDRRVEHLQAIA